MAPVTVAGSLAELLARLEAEVMPALRAASREDLADELGDLVRRLRRVR